MVKIGITGSNNTGKTTLAYKLTTALMEQGHKADCAHESVRYCPIGTKGKTLVESQIWIFAEQMQIDEVIGTHKDIIVCDKTAIDTLAYGIWAFEQNPSDKQRNRLVALEYMASKYAETYDKLFLLPVLKNIHYHKWVEGVDHRKRIDELVRKVLKDFKLEYTEIKNKSQTGRVKEILKNLDLQKI